MTMSDTDGDIDDELLELAGATEKKRKRQASGTKQSGHKKRRARYALFLAWFVHLLYTFPLALPTASRRMPRKAKKNKG